MFKKIILAVDGSENAVRALELTAELASSCAATVVIVHAYEPVSYLLGANPLTYQNRVNEHIAWSGELLKEAHQKLLEQGLKEVNYRILQGSPATAIANAALEEDADLIVMGSRGLTPMTGLLLGSVSERVIGMAHCPVLVVR
jgi:nucleotide-binding universal stress UspA family protein